MADPQALADRTRILAQLSNAARAFARGEDGTSMLPLEMRPRVERWRRTLAAPPRLSLDLEGWLIGLTTLACLERSAWEQALPDLRAATRSDET